MPNGRRFVGNLGLIDLNLTVMPIDTGRNILHNPTANDATQGGEDGKEIKQTGCVEHDADRCGGRGWNDCRFWEQRVRLWQVRAGERPFGVRGVRRLNPN